VKSVQESKVSKTDPDVLRVTVYVLNQRKTGEYFSVSSASSSEELNGINEYRIAEILRDICLQPDGPNSIEQLTTIDQHNTHSVPGNWELNTQTYYSYLSYLSVKSSEKSNRLALTSIKIAIVAMAISFITGIGGLLTALLN
jgi:hypothetical protein